MLKILLFVAVGVVTFLFEKMSESKSRTKEATGRTGRPVRVPASKEQKKQTFGHPKVAGATSSVHVDEYVEMAEEGARVTTDTPIMEAKESNRRSVPPLPSGGIRSAIIWSEILKRKF